MRSRQKCQKTKVKVSMKKKRKPPKEEEDLLMLLKVTNLS